MTSDAPGLLTDAGVHLERTLPIKTRCIGISRR